MLSLSPTEDIMGWEGLFWHWAGLLWEWGDEGNVKLFLLFSPMCSNLSFFFFFFLLSWCAETSLLKTFHKGPLIYEWLPKKCSPGTPRPQWRGAGVDFCIAADSTARSEICMPFTWWTGGRDPSQVLWHMVLDPTAPQRLFCLWMDVKLFFFCFVFWRGGISEGRLIWPSYWVHSSFRDYFLSRYIFLSLFLLYIFWVIFLVITVIIAIYHNLVQIKQF